MKIYDFDRIDSLRMQKERMLKRFHFHFDEHLSVSQIQFLLRFSSASSTDLMCEKIDISFS